MEGDRDLTEPFGDLERGAGPRDGPGVIRAGDDDPLGHDRTRHGEIGTARIRLLQQGRGSPRGLERGIRRTGPVLDLRHSAQRDTFATFIAELAPEVERLLLGGSCIIDGVDQQALSRVPVEHAGAGPGVKNAAHRQRSSEVGGGGGVGPQRGGAVAGDRSPVGDRGGVGRALRMTGLSFGVDGRLGQEESPCPSVKRDRRPRVHPIHDGAAGDLVPEPAP